MELSIIIPVFNEEKIISKTISTILRYLDQQYPKKAELIIVNDGSTDRTAEIVESYKSPKIKFVNYSPNHGKGYALKHGVAKASGRYIYIADTDLATPITEVDNFLKHIKSYDCVIGSRAARGAKEKSSKIRILAGQFGNAVINLLLDLQIEDTQCGFKMFKSALKETFTSCKTDGFGYDFEFLLKVRQKNATIKEIPVKWVAGEKSSVNFWSYFRTLFELIKIWWINVRFSRAFLRNAYNRSYTFRKYLTVGITSNLVNIAVFLFLSWNNIFSNFYIGEQRIPYYVIAEAVSHFVAIVVNYFLHKFYTFKVPGFRLNEILLYGMMLVINYIAGVAILFVLLDLMGINEIIAKIISLGMVVLWTFFVMKSFIYKKS